MFRRFVHVFLAIVVPRSSGASDYEWIEQIAATGGVHFLEAKTYLIDKQYQLPPNTEIHGAGSDKNTGTVIQVHVSSPYDAICGENAKNRKGFLLGDNNYIGKLYFIGGDTKRYGDNQLLCGGAPFETPGCAGAGKYSEPPDWCDGDLGIGRGVTNITVEDVTIEPFTVQIAFFAPPTKRGTKVSQGITIRRVSCDGTWADGINFHGAHKDILVEGNSIQNTGDDTYAIWSIGALQDNVTFVDNVAIKPRYRTGCWSGWDPWKCDHKDTDSFTKQYCFAIYGGKTSAFFNNKCEDAKAAIAFGNDQSHLYGGAFTGESHSRVQGMAGTLGSPCYLSPQKSIPKENLVCDSARWITTATTTPATTTTVTTTPPPVLTTVSELTAIGSFVGFFATTTAPTSALSTPYSGSNSGNHPNLLYSTLGFVAVAALICVPLVKVCISAHSSPDETSSAEEPE